MAFNPFIGWTEAELLTARRTIQEEMMTGGVITSAGSGDVSSQIQTQFGASTRLAWVMRALHILNATTYPLTDLPRNRTVAVTGTAI